MHLFFSRIFRIWNLAKISYFFAKLIKAKFRENAEFSRNDFPFSLETLETINWQTSQICIRLLF